MTFFKVFWPFFKEMFFQNQEIKDAAQKPNVVIKGLILLCFVAGILFVGYQQFGDLVSDGHRKYRDLAEDYSFVQEKYEKSVTRINELREEVYSLKRQVLEQRIIIEEGGDEPSDEAFVMLSSIAEYNDLYIKVLERERDHLFEELNSTLKQLRQEHRNVNRLESELQEKKRQMEAQNKKSNRPPPQKEQSDWRTRAQRLLDGL